tara:strand:+ start:2838 stop:3500 length:663 start_codon:yes stop_codon:yes gene_type:complete
MTVEVGTTISQLDSTKPLSGSPISEGDNHMRLIKAILKAQFPGVNGQGFSSPINASEAEINHLIGITSNVQDQIDAIVAAPTSGDLIAPAGTVMTFYQAAPPFGWTQVPTLTNSLLRIVSGAGGGAGGTDSPISLVHEHTHTTGSHALTVNEMPSHNHTIGNDPGSTSLTGIYARSESQQTGTITSSSTGGNAVHNHGATGSNTLTYAPKYIDMIIASKD